MLVNRLDKAKAELKKAQDELRLAQSEQMWYDKHPEAWMADLIFAAIGEEDEEQYYTAESWQNMGPLKTKYLERAEKVLEVTDHEQFIRIMQALGKE